MCEELKPCPFCGGKPIYVDDCGDPYWRPTFIDPDSGGGMHKMVVCESCGASIRVCETQQEAISEWNRRTEDSKVEQWNSLKRKLEGLHKGYKDGEKINYVITGSKAIEKVQELMKELETKNINQIL